MIYAQESLVDISIHAPREGGDGDIRPARIGNFGISIHAPREGGDEILAGLQKGQRISIHAPREGGDPDDVVMPYGTYISIHAPREGGDLPHDKSKET